MSKPRGSKTRDDSNVIAPTTCEKITKLTAAIANHLHEEYAMELDDHDFDLLFAVIEKHFNE